MVDRRKSLHRQASEWSKAIPDLFLSAPVPYASVVEQMAVRRLPLAEFAPRDPAATAFAEIWTELRARLEGDGVRHPSQPEKWHRLLGAIESLIAQLEPEEHEAHYAPAAGPTSVDERHRRHRQHRGRPDAGAPAVGSDMSLVHRFDTERRDLERNGHWVELRERNGSFFLVASVTPAGRSTDASAELQVQIDNSWAVAMLAGEMSPLAALEQRLGRPGPHAVEVLRKLTGAWRLRRVDTSVGQSLAPRIVEPRIVVAEAS
jgi:hypothetical protein